MEQEPIKTLIEALTETLERRSFELMLRGPEDAFDGAPLKAVVYLDGRAVDNLVAEISGVAFALNSIADAIRSHKPEQEAR